MNELPGGAADRCLYQLCAVATKRVKASHCASLGRLSPPTRFRYSARDSRRGLLGNSGLLHRGGLFRPSVLICLEPRQTAALAVLATGHGGLDQELLVSRASSP